MNKDSEFYVELGKRLSVLRTTKGLTQADLGRLLNVSYQQVQKYESGENRLSAADIEFLAAALDVPLAYFYGHDDLGLDTRLDQTSLKIAGAAPAMPRPIRRTILRLMNDINDALDKAA